jgi:hypothetical protein
MQAKSPTKRRRKNLIKETNLRLGRPPKSNRVSHLGDENKFYEVDGDDGVWRTISVVDTGYEVGSETRFGSNSIKLPIPFPI